MSTAEPPTAPPPPEPPPPPEIPLEGGTARAVGRVVLGLVLVAIGIGWLLEALGVDVPWDVVLPGALIAVGAMLVLAARSGAGQVGLIAAGVVLTILLLFGTAVDIPLDAGVGDRNIRPTAATLEREYELGIGSLTIDLTDVEDEAFSSAFDLRVRVGIGELVVLLPADAAVEVEGQAGLGDVRVFDQQEGGIDVQIVVPDAASMMSIVATVGLGEVRVERE